MKNIPNDQILICRMRSEGCDDPYAHWLLWDDIYMPKKLLSPQTLLFEMSIVEQGERTRRLYLDDEVSPNVDPETGEVLAIKVKDEFQANPPDNLLQKRVGNDRVYVQHPVVTIYPVEVEELPSGGYYKYKQRFEITQWSISRKDVIDAVGGLSCHLFEVNQVAGYGQPLFNYPQKYVLGFE